MSAAVRECGDAAQPKMLALASRGARRRQARQLRGAARSAADLLGKGLFLANARLALLPLEWLPTARTAPLDLALTAFRLEHGHFGFARLDEMARGYCAASALVDCSLAMLDDVERALRQAASSDDRG